MFPEESMKLSSLTMTHQFQACQPSFFSKRNKFLCELLQSEEDKQLQEELTMLVERLSVSIVR